MPTRRVETPAMHGKKNSLHASKPSTNGAIEPAQFVMAMKDIDVFLSDKSCQPEKQNNVAPMAFPQFDEVVALGTQVLAHDIGFLKAPHT